MELTPQEIIAVLSALTALEPKIAAGIIGLIHLIHAHQVADAVKKASQPKPVVPVQGTVTTASVTYRDYEPPNAPSNVGT